MGAGWSVLLPVPLWPARLLAAVVPARQARPRVGVVTAWRDKALAVGERSARLQVGAAVFRAEDVKEEVFRAEDEVAEVLSAEAMVAMEDE